MRNYGEFIESREALNQKVVETFKAFQDKPKKCYLQSQYSLKASNFGNFVYCSGFKVLEQREHSDMVFIQVNYDQPEEMAVYGSNYVPLAQVLETLIKQFGRDKP